MNELIPIFQHTISDDEVNAVDARELHQFLQSKQEFAHWIKNRIKAYGFVQDTDFISFDKVIKAQKTYKSFKEYYVSVDMAKELAMVERTDKGREARKYFIECEKKLKQVAKEHPKYKTPEFIKRYWANQDKISYQYFSIINETYNKLHAMFEMKYSYVIPDYSVDGKEIRIDVSIGRCFSSYLKNNYPELQDHFEYYDHKLNSGMVVPARKYKIEMYHVFINFLRNEWLPNNAYKYFQKRDPKVINLLPKLLEAA